MVFHRSSWYFLIGEYLGSVQGELGDGNAHFVVVKYNTTRSWSAHSKLPAGLTSGL